MVDRTPGRVERLIRLGEVLRRTGKSKTSIYGDKSFPRPVKIGARASAWVEEEVDRWISQRIGARTAS